MDKTFCILVGTIFFFCSLLLYFKDFDFVFFFNNLYLTIKNNVLLKILPKFIDQP